MNLFCGKNTYAETALPALIMGIINATPDSFWRESRTTVTNKGLDRALQLIDEGADILDIGGESTRPGSSYVSEEEEMARVIPLVKAIRSRSAIPLSIDTRKASVMREAVKEGAGICNDISALTDDTEMAALVKKENLAVVLMHMKETPKTMQEKPYYDDPVNEIKHYLLNRAAFAISQGIPKEHIIFDPGIGFGKRTADNFALVANIADIHAAGYPVLIGLSRKTFIGDIIGEPPENRLFGSLSATQFCVMQCPCIIRTHDVKATRDMLLIQHEIQQHGTH